jgi:hypothetical protein
MLENKIKQIKRIDPKKIAYPAILLIFFGMIFLFLFFSLKFFTKELNLILSTDEKLAGGQNQPILDMAGYGLLEKKFKLTPYAAPQAPITAEPEMTASSTAATSTADNASSSGLQPESTSTVPLAISILNSTKTPGLAGKVKTELEAAGWPVANIGNHSPVLATTTINISPVLANDSGWTAIKSVLTENGFEYIENLLPEAGEYDLEILLGSPRAR